MHFELPVAAVLPDLIEALRQEAGAVLIAPPGAGKTTTVAPALLQEEWCIGQIILTSPRRVAARAAAERMAELLGEKVGQTVGYATRLDTRQSAATRILVLTEKILVNRLVDNPELPGVSALLFDEAHERHLASDLALALALESRAVLRPDLRLLIMSATIDGTRFAGLLGPNTPVIVSEGEAHPLTICWLGSLPHERVEDSVTRAILTAWREQNGDVLAFLPGTREIARVQERLEQRLPNVPILPLHGQLEVAEQRTAIRRDREGRRRIVLATSIAETSLTLEGVSVVVDSGLTRKAQFDCAAGTTHLATVRASQAAAAQRAGRASRQGRGVVYRLWSEAAHAGRPVFDPPEIATADLSGLLLNLVQVGVSDPAMLPWLDPPSAAAVTAARQTLQELNAVDCRGLITSRGRQMAALPLDPQGAAMVLFGAEHGSARIAAKLALLLQERGLGGRGVDLAMRLSRWDADGGRRAEVSRKLADRWARQAEQLIGGEEGLSASAPAGAILAAGRPSFVAKRRDASGEHWLSAGGRGFTLDPTDPLARQELLVIGDAQGRAQAARITSAVALEEADLLRWLGARVDQRQEPRWTGDRVEARVERRLGSIVIASGPDPTPDEELVRRLLMTKAVEKLEGLLPQNLLARALFADLPKLAEERLRLDAERWLMPLLRGRRDIAISASAVEKGLLYSLSWEERQRLDMVAPDEFISPAGTRHCIAYSGPDAPSVEVRVQALFGVDEHPLVGDTPLLLKLTSPAGRPLQSTRDLPGFWRGSWTDVRKEMKGRYPKHRWPEQPWLEEASLKTKNAFSRAQS